MFNTKENIMGNRAFITSPGASVGIYTHWNGGRDSVEAFLRWAEMARLPGLDEHGSGLAQLATVMSNFFGNTGNTVLIESVNPVDPRNDAADDNGVYLVSGHTITGRVDAPEYEQNFYDLDEMVRAIDKAQPERDRLGGYLDGVSTPVGELKIGDRVWAAAWGMEGRYVVHTVLGFGGGEMVNGRIYRGVPFVDRFDNQDNSKNPNSYLDADIIRVVV